VSWLASVVNPALTWWGYRADAVTVTMVTAAGSARIVTFRNPGLFALPLDYAGEGAPGAA
jgi:hypothetical protein